MSSAARSTGGIDQMAFCHECALEIRPLMTPEPTCPRCNGSFVEIIQHDAPSQPHDFDPPPIPGFAPFPGHGGAASGNASIGDFLAALMTGVAQRATRPSPDSPSLASPRSPTSPTPHNTNSPPFQGTGSPPPQQQQSNDGHQRRSGNTSFGPFGVQWNVQYGSGGSDPYQQQQRAFQGTGAAPPPPSLSNFLQFAFGTDTHRSQGSTFAQDDEHVHDDGMGGAGGASDGRRFNHDNQGSTWNNSYHQPPPSHTNSADGSTATDMPPELAGLRNLFAGLFGGEAAGGGTLLDLLGGQATGGSRGQWGDYVLGQQGLDDIISQIMEQTQGSSGPPPAADADIDNLERFTLSDTARVHKAKNQECPTCKDDFFPDPTQPRGAEEQQEEEGEEELQQQELISMPCGHIFHVDCLVPWLQRHGTCPVCRVSIAKSSEDTSSSAAAREDGAGGSNDGWPAPPAPFASLFNQANAPSIPGSFPTANPPADQPASSNAESMRHFHPLPTASTTVTSTVYTSPVLSPAGVGTPSLETQVVNSIISSPPLVSDREEYFSGDNDNSSQADIRDRSRRAAEARFSQQHSNSQNSNARLEPDELD